MKTQIRKPINIDQVEKLAVEIHPLQAAFDQMEDHVVITDLNANIIYANKAVEKHTGFSVWEILGKNPADLWGGRMTKEFYEQMWYRIKVEKKPFIGEVENRRKDGSIYWQELRVSPILDNSGDIKFFIAIEPNTTEGNILAETRRRFLETFEENMQSSFGGMRQALDWLSTNGKLNSKQRTRLENIYKQQHNLAVLISGLVETLRYAKLDE